MITTLKHQLAYAITPDGSFPRGMEARVAGADTAIQGAASGKAFSHTTHPGSNSINSTGFWVIPEFNTRIRMPTSDITMVAYTKLLTNHGSTSAGGEVVQVTTTTYWSSYALGVGQDGANDLTGGIGITVPTNSSTTSGYSQLPASSPPGGRTQRISAGRWSSGNTVQHYRWAPGLSPSGFLKESATSLTGNIQYTSPRRLCISGQYVAESGYESRPIATMGVAVWARRLGDAELLWLSRPSNFLGFVKSICSRSVGGTFVKW